MLNVRKAWRKQEETKLKHRINQLLNEGNELDESLATVAAELGRTTRGCKDRWNLIYKRRNISKVVEIPTHEYAELFKQFGQSYADIEKVMGDLVNENERLKQRVAYLESIEQKYAEAKNYFLKEKEAI